MDSSKIRYIVNKEKRTVVAILEGCSLDCVGDILRRGTFLNVGHLPSSLDKYLLPNKIIGVSKCHPEDSWDESIGKQVARRKLVNTYYKLKINILNTYLKDIMLIHNRLREFSETLSFLVKENNNL